MANVSEVQDPGNDARTYGAYQNEVYAAGMFHSILPTVTKDPNKLEAQAEKALSSKSYSYVAGGAGERATMDANRLAFRQWKVRALAFQLISSRLEKRMAAFQESVDTSAPG
jgi:lactate 2-monooxygenase